MLKTFSLEELRQPLSALAISGDAAFSRVSTDTRTLAAGDLFVALSGPNFDGNRFVEQAQAQGAVAAIVSELQPLDLPQLQVADTRQALGQLGALNRQQFQGPVTAITGSCGKTTVKEMLTSILREHSGQSDSIWSTQGNLNNDIGAPLTLLALAPQHEYAVVELGASGAGEIAYTTGLTQPQVAILNNARGAHLEGFGSLDGVVKAKGEIFAGLAEHGTGVVNLDDPNHHYWLGLLAGKRVLTFSLRSASADLYASHLAAHSDCCFSFVLHAQDQQQPVQLAVMGQHMVANALAAASAALALGVSLPVIAQGLSTFVGVSGRMSVLRRADGLRVIDDSYNANPDSVRAAIEVLANLPGRRVLVLGNMAELGEDYLTLHREVGEFAAEQRIELLLTSGNWAGAAAEGYRDALDGAESKEKLKEKHPQACQAREFDTNAQLLAWLENRATADMVILVKGSRSAGMETVVTSLMNKEQH